MKSIAERLREGRYNNLEDLIWEASDRAENPDTAIIFQLLAKKVSALEKDVDDERAEARAEIEESEDEEFYSGFDFAIRAAGVVIDAAISDLDDDPVMEKELLAIQKKINKLTP